MREEDESNIRGGWTDMDLYEPKPKEIIFHINPCYTTWHCGEVGAADITTTNEKDVTCKQCISKKESSKGSADDRGGIN
jgi:hypothetical protein